MKQLIAILGILFLAACSGGQNQDRYMGFALEHTGPTATARPSNPRPTINPQAQQTDHGIPPQVQMALRNPELVKRYEPPLMADFETQFASQVLDGISIIEQGYIYREFPLVDYYAVLVSFKFQPKSGEQTWDFYINLQTAEPLGSEDYLAMGVNSYNEILYGAQDEYFSGPYIETLDVQPNTWYDVLLTVDPNGSFLIYIWEKDGSQEFAGTLFLGDEWLGREWALTLWCGEGSLRTDQIDVYRFEEIMVVDNSDL